MSFLPWPSNTYNQILPPQNLAVSTGGGAFLGDAHFTGSGHAFGNNSSIVNNNINNTFTTIYFSDGEFTEVQRNLIGDYIANHAVLPVMNDNLNRNLLTQLIINLPRAEAVFNDYQTKKKSGPCFEGTRVALLREMADWVTGTGDSRMYVLSGLAGIGKSTVACTVASRAADLNLLGASFFFSRGGADRKNAKKFFTTIAFQLCVYNESFSKAIGDALLTERGSAATTKGPQEQLKALILDPLQDIVRSLDGTLCLWNSGSGELIDSFDDHHQDRDWDRDKDFLQFSATGTRLAYYMSANERVRLRNGINGRLIGDLDCYSRYHMAFSLDGSRIACSHYKSGLKLWGYDDGELIGIAEDYVWTDELAISANGSLLATASYYTQKVKLWSGNSGNPLPVIEVINLDRDASSLAFSPDDILAIEADFYARLYDTKSRSFISTVSISGSIEVFSPDSTRLAARFGDLVCLSDIRLGSIEASSPSSNKDTIGGFEFRILAFSMDRSRLACAFWGGTIELWETGNLTKRQIVQTHHIRGLCVALVFSPDGRQFASGSDDGTIKLWHSEDGALRGDVQYPNRRLRAVGISNTMLAAAGNHGVVLWDRKTLDHIHTFLGIFTTPVSFSANGTLLAAAAINASNIIPDQLIVFDVTTCTCIATFQFRNQSMHQIAFLPDNSQIVAQPRDDDEFLTFNLVNGEVKQGPIFEHLIQLHSMPFWHGG